MRCTGLLYFALIHSRAPDPKSGRLGVGGENSPEAKTTNMEKPTQQQIDDVLNRAAEAEEEGTKWPGMSYEQGVKAGIEWVLGYIDSNPMDDE